MTVKEKEQEDFNIFNERFRAFDELLFPVKWVWQLKAYHHKDFTKTYLIPKVFVNHHKNEIAFFYALVIAVNSRKLKSYDKVLYFSEDKEEDVERVLFLLTEVQKLLKFKSKILKNMEVLQDFRDFAYVAYAYLADVYNAILKSDDNNGNKGIIKKFNQFKNGDKELSLKRMKLKLIKKNKLKRGYELKIVKGDDVIYGKKKE
jgi:hypothetical protein